MKPRMLRWFAAMAALVLMAVAFEENFSQAAGGSVYRDPQGRFVVQVPAGWNAAEAEGGARLSRGNAYANVMVMEGAQGGWNLGEQVVGQVSQQWRNFREINRGDRQLGALPASFGLYTGVNPKGISAFFKVFVAPGPGRTFVLMLS